MPLVVLTIYVGAQLPQFLPQGMYCLLYVSSCHLVIPCRHKCFCCSTILHKHYATLQSMTFHKQRFQILCNLIDSLFRWMSDLFSLGYKKPLDESDLSKQPYADTCDPLSEKFER